MLDSPAVGVQSAVDGGAEPLDVAPELVTYHVLLLAGEPRRHTCTLPAGIEAGADVEVTGEQWTVADVRGGQDGASATLICIYAV
jgi:hypothetical protein